MRVGTTEQLDRGCGFCLFDQLRSRSVDVLIFPALAEEDLTANWVR
jgi:hypothetical protein